MSNQRLVPVPVKWLSPTGQPCAYNPSGHGITDDEIRSFLHGALGKPVLIKKTGLIYVSAGPRKTKRTSDDGLLFAGTRDHVAFKIATLRQQLQDGIDRGIGV